MSHVRFSGLKWIVLIVVEIFVVALVLWKSISEPITELTFGQEDLLHSTGAAGFYIDTSEEEIITTPDIILSPGIYTLNVKYVSVGEAVIFAQYVDGRFNGNVSGDIPTANMSERQCDFKVTYSERPLRIIGRMRGDSGAGDYLRIDEITVKTSPLNAWNIFFTLTIIFSILNIIIYIIFTGYLTKISLENREVVKGLIAITLFASIPLMVDYLPSSGHDLQFHLTRIEGIKAGLKNSIFPVRIQPNWLNDYGYASSIFYGDIFLYIPALLRIFGVSLQASYQFYILVVNIATAYCAYWCFANMSTKKIGIICSAVYSLNIYRLVNIYSRAAVGEYTAMIFLPMILYGFWCVYHFESNHKEHKGSWKGIVFGCTGVFMAHMITCELVAIFIILGCLILWKKTFQKQNFLILIKSLVLIILLNLWFLIPFMDYMLTGTYVINSPDSWVPFRADERASFVAQLFMNTYNVIGSSQEHELGIINEMPQTLGSVTIIVIGVWFLWYMGERHTATSLKREERIAVCFLGLTLLFSTYLVPYTRLGEALPFLQYPIRSIQYAWRFLALGGLFLTWLLCVLLYNNMVSSQKRHYIKIAIIVVTLGQALSFTSDILYKNEPIRIYDEGNITMSDVGAGEYLPIKSIDYKKYEKDLNYDPSFITVKNWKLDENIIEIEASNLSDTPQYIAFPRLYYKGYRAVDDQGGELVVTPEEYGRVSVLLPEMYTGRFSIKFIEPWYWRVGELISLFVGIFLLVLIKKERTDQWKLGKFYKTLKGEK